MKHGHGRSGQQSAEYNAWRHMLARCRNPKHPNYPRYGARGITVCTRWESFPNFLADMGQRPSPKHSLERLDVNGPYSPSDCVWSPITQQARNKRPCTSSKLTEEGVSLIRGMFAAGHSQQAIAGTMHVSQSMVTLIKRGRHWSDSGAPAEG